MFIKRLEQTLKEQNIAKKKFLSDLGLGVNSITHWRNRGNTPSADVVKKIAEYLGVSIDYLLGNADTPEPGTVINIFDIPGIEPMPKTKKIPLLGDIACGEPILAEENLEGYIKLEDGVKADFALRCKGDSMINARIMDGDIVYIRQQPMVENGQIAAVLIDGEATLKRVYITGDTIILHPENSSYQPMVFTRESGADIRILGKAVAFTSPII